MGHIEWSVEFGRALYTHRYRHLHWLRLQGHNISLRQIQRTALKANVEFLSHYNLPAVTAFRQSAWLDYKQAKKRATSLRGQHLDDLAIARTEAGLEAPGQALCSMKSRE